MYLASPATQLVRHACVWSVLGCTYRTDTLLCDTLLAPPQQFTVVPTAVLLPELCLVNKTVMTIDITYAACTARVAMSRVHRQPHSR